LAASANGTVVFINDGTSITDANGHVWTINTSGKVTVDGAVDSTTSSVTELAYVGGSVFKLAPGGGQPVPFITPGNGTFTDASGNVWSITTADDSLQENGNLVFGGSGTGQAAYYNGTVYAQDEGSGAWFTYDGTNFNPAPSPPPTTTAIPYITPGSGSFTDGSAATWSIDSAGNVDRNGSPVSGGAAKLAAEFYQNTVYAQDATSRQWSSWNGSTFTGPVTAPPSPTAGWSRKTLPTDTWTASATNPLATSAFVSQNNTVINLGSTAKIIDGNGNAYGLLNVAGGEVNANGIPDSSIVGVTELAFVNGEIWRFVPNAGAGLWWHEPNPAGPWQPTGGTAVSPLPAAGGKRAPADQPFTSSSVWNVGIGTGATWGAATDADVAQLIALTGNVLGATNGQATFIGAPSDPLVQITCTDTDFAISPQSVHVPITAKPSPGADGWMNFFDLSQPTKLWSYAGCTLVNGVDVTGGIRATKGGVWDCTGDGVANASNPGSDYNFFAGTINDYDLANGVIQHALRFSLGLNVLKTPGATWTASIPWPGTHEDKNGPTTYTGNVFYGSTVGIPSTTTLPSLPREV
jgi:hypothetical protein